MDNYTAALNYLLSQKTNPYQLVGQQWNPDAQQYNGYGIALDDTSGLDPALAAWINGTANIGYARNPDGSLSNRIQLKEPGGKTGTLITYGPNGAEVTARGAPMNTNPSATDALAALGPLAFYGATMLAPVAAGGAGAGSGSAAGSGALGTGAGLDTLGSGLYGVGNPFTPYALDPALLNSAGLSTMGAVGLDTAGILSGGIASEAVPAAAFGDLGTAEAGAAGAAAAGSASGAAAAKGGLISSALQGMGMSSGLADLLGGAAPGLLGGLLGYAAQQSALNDAKQYYHPQDAAAARSALNSGLLGLQNLQLPKMGSLPGSPYRKL